MIDPMQRIAWAAVYDDPVQGDHGLGAVHTGRCAGRPDAGQQQMFEMASDAAS